MTPRVFVEPHADGWKVHIRWPDQRDEPATTVLHGPGYGTDHLGFTPAIPGDAVELRPVEMQPWWSWSNGGAR